VRNLNVPSSPRLSAYRRPVDGPLHLLSRSENGLTFALGYALARVPRLLESFLADVGLPVSAARSVSISLQEPDKDGITDIELWLPRGRLLAIVEAKKDGWPGREQLSRYAKRLRDNGVGRCTLIPLGVPPEVPAISEIRQLRGIDVVPRRWADLLSLASDAIVGRNDEQAHILRELKDLIHEVIKMRSYDREVLIRDMDTDETSYQLFLDYNLYACQTEEISEPLFFAPCFTKKKNKATSGIHYVSRVYSRSVIAVKNQHDVRAALEEARKAVERIASPLRRRKRASDQVDYLNGLHRKWGRGLRFLLENHWRPKTAVFFLGDPLRLPLPLAKSGSQIPIGFSMTMEQLMSAKPGTFNC